jgi:hypothetical protein
MRVVVPVITAALVIAACVLSASVVAVVAALYGLYPRRPCAQGLVGSQIRSTDGRLVCG